MKCSECKKPIPKDVVIFVIPKDVNFSMTGKRTKAKTLCYTCAPSMGSIGCYFTLNQ